PSTVAACAKLPGVVGIKDSSDDPNYLTEVRRRLSDRPDFKLFVGPEERLAEALIQGAHGGVCGGANFHPRLYVDLVAAVRNNHGRLAVALDESIGLIGRQVYAV